MFEFASKPQSIWNVQKDALRLYVQSFSQIWFLGVFAALVGMGSTYVEGLLGMVPGKVQSGFSAEIWIIILLSQFFYALINSLMLHRIYNIVHEPKSTMKTSWRFVIKLLPTIYVSFLMFYFIIMLGSLLAINISGIFSLFTLLILMLCFFFLPFILFENKGVLEAFSSSIQLIWRNLWRTFAVFVPPILVMMLALSFFVQEGEMPPIATQNIINTLLSLTVVLYFAALTLVQFNNLLLRQKE